MFDPKVLLEGLLAGAAKSGQGSGQGSSQGNSAPAASAVDLGEILRRMGGAAGQGPGQGQGQGQSPQGGGGLAEILEKLGKHSVSKGCLYIKRLSDIDLPTLKKLIRETLKQKKQRST